MNDTQIVAHGVGTSNDKDRSEIGNLKRMITNRLRGPIDLAKLADRTLTPLDFTLGPIGLLKHACGVLAAPGATGKGYFTLGLAASVACEEADIPFFGIAELPAPEQRGRVVLLSVEDPREVLEARTQSLLLAIRKRYGQPAVASIEANLKVESLFGEAPCLVAKGGDADTPLCRAWQEIIAEKIAGTRLFSLDTASCYHRADENNNGEMTVFMQVCNRLAMETVGSGLLPHHTPKGDPEQVRGATAITNSARWVCNLVGDANDKIKVTAYVRKENNIAPIADFTVQRGAGGILQGAGASRTTRRAPAAAATTREPTRTWRQRSETGDCGISR